MILSELLNKLMETSEIGLFEVAEILDEFHPWDLHTREASNLFHNGGKDKIVDALLSGDPIPALRFLEANYQYADAQLDPYYRQGWGEHEALARKLAKQDEKHFWTKEIPDFVTGKADIFIEVWVNKRIIQFKQVKHNLYYVNEVIVNY